MLVKANHPWADILPSALVWYDYISIPQLSDGPTCNLSAEDTKDAIASIASYVGRANHFFILAPPLLANEGPIGGDNDSKRVKVTAEVRSYSTWLARGWCALEHFAMAMKPRTPGIRNSPILVQSSSDMCFSPMQGLIYAQIGKLDFTCCQRGHLKYDEKTGRSTEIHCDKDLIYPVVKNILEKKIESLENSKKWSKETKASYRNLLAMKSYYLCGFKDANKSESEAHERESTTSLTEFLRIYKFKNVHQNDGGWTPLRCAAISNNLPIVRKLIFLGVDVNAPIKRTLAETWTNVSVVKGTCFCMFSF